VNASRPSRLCSGQRRRHRSHRGDLRENEGWKTRTFPEKTCLHHRDMGTAQRGPVARGSGLRKDYAIGNHPLWEIFRSLYQMSRKPFVVEGSRWIGVFLALVRRRERRSRRSSSHFIGEQMHRLKRFFRRSEKKPRSRRRARQWIGIDAALGKRVMQAVVHDVTLHDPPTDGAGEP